MIKIHFLILLLALTSFGKELKKTPAPIFKSWEVRTAPLAYLARWITLDVSYRLNENFALGPAAVLYNSQSTRGGMFTPTYKGTALGAQGYYYFRSVMGSSWYLGGRFYKENYRSYPHSFLGYDDRDGWRTNATIGYQARTQFAIWMFGIGPEYTTYDVTTREDNKTDVVGSESFFGMALEFKVGVDF